MCAQTRDPWAKPSTIRGSVSPFSIRQIAEVQVLRGAQSHGHSPDSCPWAHHLSPHLHLFPGGMVDTVRVGPTPRQVSGLAQNCWEEADEPAAAEVLSGSVAGGTGGEDMFQRRPPGTPSSNLQAAPCTQKETVGPFYLCADSVPSSWGSHSPTSPRGSPSRMARASGITAASRGPQEDSGCSCPHQDHSRSQGLLGGNMPHRVPDITMSRATQLGEIG